MGFRMQDEDWAHLEATEVFGHREARMVGEEYAWGCYSCWFAAEGEIAAPTMPDLEPGQTWADRIDRAHWWWAQGEDSREMSPREVIIRQRMRVYVEGREAAGDLGEVPGWAALWPVRETVS